MKHIILIGFMGAGKTTVGKRLAVGLNAEFLDTDSCIEKKAGMAVSQIFETQGEEAFRAMETQMLRELLSYEEGCVISCGGGLPLREENALLLKRLGTVVYLEVSAATVQTRLSGDTTRPLLQGTDAAKRIEKLLLERRERYEAAADICICVDGKTPKQICEELMTFISEKS